jgi:hypothetical protein
MILFKSFQLYVINCNKVFCCCLSRRILETVSNDRSIKEYHLKDIQNEKLFISFFNILSGDSFEKVNYSNREVIEYFSIVGWSFEIAFNFENYHEIIWFVSLPFSKNQTEQYMKCITNISKNFENIPTHLLNKLSNQTLELVFNSGCFIKPNETFLLKFIFQDVSKHWLLKFIDLLNLDSINFKRFIEYLKANKIDFELFENIKELLFFQQDLNQKLQIEITTLQQEIESINIKFQNSISKIKEKNKKIRADNTKFEEENKKMNEELLKLSKEIQMLKKENTKVQEENRNLNNEQ